MSELKVNKISPRSGTDVTLGDSGDTFTIPAGASMVNNGTATGFGATGAVNWDTTAKTANFTAVSKVGYFVDTTSGAITVTLPATPSAGDIVGLVDYAGTFDTNALVIDPNGEDIEGGTINLQLTGEREGVVLVYVDSTQGWLPISGINEGTDALEPIVYSVDFLVVAGGGGTGDPTISPQYSTGGGGAGGFRTSTQTVTQGTTITVTVGDGGQYSNGSNSSISGSGLTTITSAGGGEGGDGGPNPAPGSNGGSGGGGGGQGLAPGSPGGSGNTPSTAPSQGNNGGSGVGTGNTGAGGGGGATAVGGNGAGTGSSGDGGNGGAGTASSITGSSVTYAGGGGGGGGYVAAPGTSGGTGGVGGGGNGSHTTFGSVGVVNTGGGGGGGRGGLAPGASGGKGVVILSMPLASFSNTTTGSPTESDDGTTKVLIYNGDGSYTA
jgi:hypothetical protein